MYISPVKKHHHFVKNNIQNAGVQEEPLRFHMIFFHSSVCNFERKKIMYICLVMNAKNARQICHPGEVERIDGHKVYVRIASQAACGHCRAKSHCGMAESVDKVVEVDSDDPSGHSPGQQVEIVLERSLGYKALLIGYILPFLILLGSLFAVYFITGNEGLAALIAVALMAPYYAFLYRYREKLRKTFHFSIRQPPVM